MSAEIEHKLSDYEKLRLERIARNEARLRELGLFKYNDKIKALNNQKKKRKKKQSSPRVEPGQERRSNRLSPEAAKLYALSNAHDDEVAIEVTGDNKKKDDTDYGNNDGMFLEEQVTVRQVKRRLKMIPNDWVLSEEQKEVLQGNMDDQYLEKFREFLRYHDKISDQNERNVMRQVVKLARGEGIRYESPRYGWPENCYFMPGRKITPLDDIVELMEHANECENKWGRDHGNGWLLSHPLKKLLLFQQFCLNNPNFLSSKRKIKEFVRREEEEEDDDDDDDDEEEEEEEEEEEGDNGETKTEKKAKEAKEKASSITTETASIASTSTNSTRNIDEDTDVAEPVYVGARIAKDFEDGLFFGTVTKYYPNQKLCAFVEYDDGDSEDMNKSELNQCLRHYKNHRAKEHIGARIAKDFDDGLFFGTITKYYPDEKKLCVFVEYDDGDFEDMNQTELNQCLRHYKKHRVKDPENNNKKKRGGSCSSRNQRKNESTKKRKAATRQGSIKKKRRV